MFKVECDSTSKYNYLYQPLYITIGSMFRGELAVHALNIQ